jgi:hypothetical protein
MKAKAAASKAEGREVSSQESTDQLEWLTPTGQPE